SVRDTALDALTGLVDTAGEGVAVVVTNTLSFARSGRVAVDVPGGRLFDDSGAEVPCVVDRGRLYFHAEDVPAMGWRTWHLLPGSDPMWTFTAGATISNERYRVTADAARGGGLASIYDKVLGRELLRDGAVGNELRVYEEYPAHPDFGEGPWHLVPSGPVVGATAGPASQVRMERSPLGERLVVAGSVGEVAYEQTVTLWYGVDRVDFTTRVVDFGGVDRLVRVRFPVDLPCALPVSGVA